MSFSNADVWGGNSSRLLLLSVISLILRARAVITAHDVFLVRESQPSSVRLLKLFSRCGVTLLTLSQEDSRAIAGAGFGAVDVIPHFIPSVPTLPASIEAKSAVNLAGYRVVTLLGYLFPRKGHELLMHAMKHLPSDVRVVFAGEEPHTSSGYLQHLTSLATELNVADRVCITGFLQEPAFWTYLAATDLAVCPFQQFSASGTLSIWIAVGRPVLISDQPQAREYLDLEAESFRLFSPYTAEALGAAILDALAADPQPQLAALARLKARLSLSVTVDRYLAYMTPERR